MPVSGWRWCVAPGRWHSKMGLHALLGLVMAGCGSADRTTGPASRTAPAPAAPTTAAPTGPGPAVPPPGAGLRIAGDLRWLYPRFGRYVNATAMGSNGRLVSWPASWTVSDSSVVEVSLGQLIALRPGTAEVTASYGGAVASTMVEVSPLPPPADSSIVLEASIATGVDIEGEAAYWPAVRIAGLPAGATLAQVAFVFTRLVATPVCTVGRAADGSGVIRLTPGEIAFQYYNGYEPPTGGAVHRVMAIIRLADGALRLLSADVRDVEITTWPTRNPTGDNPWIECAR